VRIFFARDRIVASSQASETPDAWKFTPSFEKCNPPCRQTLTRR